MGLPLPPWLIWLETCDSTNAWVARQVDWLYHGQVIYTPHQTHGRGQYGRRWVSGGFTASFILSAAPTVTAPSLLAGLGILRAVESLVPSLQHQLQLKWPNDVMAAGKKLAGILCEQHQGWLVVGVGLNRCRPVNPEKLPQAVSLDDLTNPVPSELDLLVAIRDELLWCWSKADNGQDWLQALNERDFLRGRCVTITPPQNHDHILCQGEAVGINADGQLQVRLAAGKIITVASGHVLC